ncbi:alpha/beta fold hydrolase [Streptomyces sp. LX-29]|uniref:thioesterase II family protein n=1 Tax=Streptomyces sp. LX-29 TaxID=2900152 RepID=UPI00240D35DC|nr:alpha/beta fold hydrolase [Streptomyces sp. LX-29]WFB10773.1 alpha/beta fold hydrolase [Streptomyces sp. LX-29]
MSPTRDDPAVVFPFGLPDPEAPVRVFCLPYAGGGAGLYRTWARRGDADAAFVPVQLPGRENRLHEEPEKDFDSLAERLATVIAPWTGDRYALFGHSMGGMLAHELARRLEELTGTPARLLAVSACAAPDVERPEWRIHDLPREEFVAQVRRLNGTPRELFEDEDLLDLCLPRIRADFSVLASYRYRPRSPLAMPVTAFGGTRDDQVPTWSVENWREHTDGDFRLHLVDDDHFFLHRHEQAVAEHIRDALRRVDA